MKNNILVLVLCIVFIATILSPLAKAHVIEKSPETKILENYKISFSTSPKFPITYKGIYLDFIIKDKEGNEQSRLNVKIEIHKKGKVIELDLQEESKGHYSVKNKFTESGEHEIHLIIDGKELKTEFNLEIDSLGKSGLLRIGIIILFILILLVLMYKDCKNKEWRHK